MVSLPVTSVLWLRRDLAAGTAEVLLRDQQSFSGKLVELPKVSVVVVSPTDEKNKQSIPLDHIAVIQRPSRPRPWAGPTWALTPRRQKRKRSGGRGRFPQPPLLFRRPSDQCPGDRVLREIVVPMAGGGEKFGTGASGALGSAAWSPFHRIPSCAATIW